MSVTTANLVELRLDDAASSKDEAIDRLVAVATAAGRVTDPVALRSDVAAREALLPTGIEGGIGIPHARSAGIAEPTVVFGRTDRGLDWGAADGPAHLVFLIAVPEGAGDEHLTLLASLSRALMREEFRATLRSTDDPQVVVDTIAAATGAPVGAAAAPAATTPAAAPAAPAPEERRPMRFVAVTSCPTGIAHTYMAAEALEQAARAAGHEITVETQGSGGFKKLDPAVIAAADGVIFANDVEVRDRARFAGKPTVQAGVKRAINDAGGLVSDAELAVASGVTTPAAPVAAAGAAGGASGGMATKVEEGHWGIRLRGYLMTGVSYMIPFVAGGGILIALSFMLGGFDIVEVNADVPGFIDAWSPFNLQDWAGLMFILGAVAFGFLNAVLAGFIAYAIADRPGLVPGFVAGVAAGTIGAGFLGAIVGGLTGGFIARWLSQLNVPNAIRGVMPVVIIPLVATFLNGLLMLTVLGKPLAALQTALTEWLAGLSGANAILLGAILGLMMAFDMGGPVNKTAYVFATLNLTQAIADNNGPALQIMAAVMAAGMVPPLALALSSTVLRPKLYTEAERENGKAAWLLGASFITEGAIPFAASDPLRVIPSIMAGSALTGALVMAFGSELRAPHGGIWVIGLVSNPIMYLVAIVAGTVVAALAVTALKSRNPVTDEQIEEQLTHAAIA
ncbi:MAG: fructose-specific PTS transporter subunit EIIC [Candidatus Nanopelagicales bacterium]|jgi:PTS system fructose-specific IIC component|nr:fructose-specific PTS transporter subunit EIIC [Candidatus Nanopelagicales bacterium]